MPGNHDSKKENSQDEEEDYMSMIIEEPPQRETFAQRKLRKQREVRDISPPQGASVFSPGIVACH